MKATQKKLIGHAALIMLVAFAAGVGLLISLLGGIELIPGHIIPLQIFGSTDGWRIAHLGGLTNGMLLLLIAAILPVLGFAPKAECRLAWMLIGTGWANTLFYWAALFAPNKALSIAPNRFGPSNIASIIGLVPALVFVVVAIIAFIMIARQAFSGTAEQG